METAKEAFIRMLAEGISYDEAFQELTGARFLAPAEEVQKWYRDPDVLTAAIEKSNDLIGQAWGTMWKSIKLKAMLGSVQHSKLLIEFLQNGKRLADSTLKVIFDEATAGKAEVNGDDS